MTDRSSQHWYPTAAYLYTLHLDGPALAWEYLRRNPSYRRDWLRRRRKPDAAQAWGLRLLEDPGLDARDAHPASRPTPAALLELHTLQALDATLAGASLREVGEGLFGADAVAADWHKDSALRARVRRLVRRGDELMHGGYRRLAQLPMFPSH